MSLQVMMWAVTAYCLCRIVVMFWPRGRGMEADALSQLKKSYDMEGQKLDALHGIREALEDLVSQKEPPATHPELEEARAEVVRLKADVAELNLRLHERTQGFLRNARSKGEALVAPSRCLRCCCQHDDVSTDGFFKGLCSVCERDLRGSKRRAV